MLGLTQPALSKSIRGLEDELQVKLFDRYKDGVVVTAIGQILLTHSKLISTEVRHASEAIASARTGLSGGVILGAAFSMVETLLPTATARLIRSRPGVRVQLLAGLNDDLLEDLRRGDVDLVLSAFPDPQRDDDLVREHLFVDQVNVVVRSGHPLAISRHRKMADLLDYPWVIFGPQIVSKQRMNAAFVTAGLPPPIPNAESNSSTYNKRLLRRSDFVSYMPYHLIRREHKSGQLMPLPFDGLTWNRSVGITHRRRGSLSPTAIALIGEIKKVVREIEGARHQDRPFDSGDVS